MPAPSTSVFDDFTYAAGNLPGAQWGAGYGDATLVADGTTSATSGVAQPTWEGSYSIVKGSISGDVEIYIVMNNGGTVNAWEANDEIDLHWHSTLVAGGAPNGNWKGYGLAIKANAGLTDVSLRVMKYDGSTVTWLNTAVFLGRIPAAGEKFGITHIGTTIQMWNDSGSGWTQVGSDITSESSYTAGYLGMEMFIGVANRLKVDGMGGGAPATTNPKVATFTEDFSGTLSAWTNDDANGGVSSIVGARLQQASGASTTALPQARIETTASYDLTNSQAFAQFFTAPPANVISAFRLFLDDNNWVGIRYDAGNLVAYKTQASTPSDLGTVAYNSSTMKYLQISHSGSTVHLSYSADGVVWTDIGTTTLSFAITALKPQFITYSTVSQTAKTAVWDSVNVLGLQFSRPSADVAAGGWTPTPGSPTTLFDKLDEVNADDTDYISAVAS